MPISTGQRIVPSTSPPTSTDIVTVVTRRGQHGVAALVDLRQGDLILTIDGPIVGQPSRYSVQIARDQHVEVGADRDGTTWRFLNHACHPNAVLRGRELRARLAIRRGDEVTFDYTTTEFDMASPFACACGAADCLGWVRGFAHLTPAQQQQRAPDLADYLRAVLVGR